MEVFRILTRFLLRGAGSNVARRGLLGRFVRISKSGTALYLRIDAYSPDETGLSRHSCAGSPGRNMDWRAT